MNLEIEKLRQTSAAQAVDAHKFGQLWIELTATREKLDQVRLESEKKINAQDQMIEDLRRLNSQLEQMRYENQISLEGALADTLLLRKDLSRSETELRNLKTAIQAFQAEKEQFQIRLSIDKANIEESMKRHYMSEYAILEDKYKQINHAKQQELDQLLIQLEDEKLLRRKSEMDLQAEKMKMQRALEGALQQLHNTQEDTVDRALITNLVVTYFRRNRYEKPLGCTVLVRRVWAIRTHICFLSVLGLG